MTAHHRIVSSPLTESMLRPPEPECTCIQFDHPLAEEDCSRLAEWLRCYPTVTLRAYDLDRRDLDFLRHFPALERFAVDCVDLESLDGLQHLPETTKEITIGFARRRLSLRSLRRFAGLRRLSVERQTVDIDVIGELTTLRSLTLRSITLPDLAVLRPLRDLRALDLKLGGIRDLSLLPSVGRLEYLELWQVRGLADLAPIAGLEQLRHLFLQSLPQVTTLPDLSGLTRLETVRIEELKGLTDLTPLLSAPALRQLVIGARHLRPTEIAVVGGHPTLVQLSAWLGSGRKDAEVRRLVPLPEVSDWARPDVYLG